MFNEFMRDVVYLLIPTSNHNVNDRIDDKFALYIF